MLRINYQNIKRKLFFITLLLALGSNIYSKPNSLKSSDSTRNAIEINFLNEQSLYYTYQITSGIFWKIGTDLSSNFSESKDNTPNSKIITNNIFAIRINNQFFINLFKHNSIVLSYGLGPSFFYSKRLFANETRKYQNKSSYWEYGLLNSLSSQVILSENIYLIFRYDYTISKGTEFTERNYIERESTSYKKYYTNMDLSDIKIGIGVRF